MVAPRATRPSIRSACSSASVMTRREATTIAVIELPIIMPLRGTRVRPERSNTPSPNRTPRVTMAAPAKAVSANPNAPSTSGARRRTVQAANITITATQIQAYAIGSPSSTTSRNATPTRASWTNALAEAVIMSDANSRLRTSETTTATPTSSPEMATPVSPICEVTRSVWRVDRTGSSMVPNEGEIAVGHRRPRRLSVRRRRGPDAMESTGTDGPAGGAVGWSARLPHVSFGQCGQV